MASQQVGMRLRLVDVIAPNRLLPRSRVNSWINKVEASDRENSDEAIAPLRSAPLSAIGSIQMNRIRADVEIHFHEQEVLSIYHETTCTSDEEKFVEGALCGAFAIRSLSNLGSNETSDSLSRFLHGMQPQIISASIDELTTKGDPSIIRYPGTPGRKKFICSIEIAPRKATIGYKAKGFGFFATRIGFYCPVSVISLFRYFAARRSNDQDFRVALAGVASGCGQFQLRRQINMTNHAGLVVPLVQVAMPSYSPNWL